MKIHLVLLSLVLSLPGCLSQPVRHDFFATQDQFAANRESQTSRYDGVEYDAMLGHVVESLLDLDCVLQETNKLFGVISAQGKRVRSRERNRMVFPGIWHSKGSRDYWSCAGHNVTVKVTQMAEGKLAVRATFLPPNPKADKAFQLLIERSIALSR